MIITLADPFIFLISGNLRMYYQLSSSKGNVIPGESVSGSVSSGTIWKNEEEGEG